MASRSDTWDWINLGYPVPAGGGTAIVPGYASSIDTSIGYVDPSKVEWTHHNGLAPPGLTGVLSFFRWLRWLDLGLHTIDVAHAKDLIVKESMRRRSMSYSASEYQLTRNGCMIEGDEVVWPDGERWPRGRVSG